MNTDVTLNVLPGEFSRRIEALAGELRRRVDEIQESLRWKPIETAPMDGRWLLFYAHEHGQDRFGSGYYFRGVPGDGGGWVCWSFQMGEPNAVSGTMQPTHWRDRLDPPVR